MDSKKLTCKGAHCDRPQGCRMAGACLYKSSAEEALELKRDSGMAMVVYNPPLPKVEDFSGAVDGGGIKSVMKHPKTAVQLIDPHFIEGIGEVLRFGAEKYAANNWMRGMSWVTVLGGILRHTLAFARGEEMDKESGLPHLHHAACGLMFLCYYAHVRRDQHSAFDDRVFK